MSSTRFTPPPTDHGAAPARPMHYTTDRACWRHYVADLIDAATISPACYARAVKKRKPRASEAVAERMGADMGRVIARMFPDLTGVALSRAATGDDQTTERDRRQRFALTVAACRAWLPPEPPSGRQLADAERDRRAGTTEAQRQANAEANAQDWGPR